MEIYQKYGDGDGSMGKLPKLVFIVKDLGHTVDPSGLQGPPGSSLLLSVTQLQVL